MIQEAWLSDDSSNELHDLVDTGGIIATSATIIAIGYPKATRDTTAAVYNTDLAADTSILPTFNTQYYLCTRASTLCVHTPNNALHAYTTSLHSTSLHNASIHNSRTLAYTANMPRILQTYLGKHTCVYGKYSCVQHTCVHAASTRERTEPGQELGSDAKLSCVKYGCVCMRVWLSRVKYGCACMRVWRSCRA
jgi:hypothetical protein